eukprot:3582980-Pyramimonas_sp.AAC.1
MWPKRTTKQKKKRRSERQLRQLRARLPKFLLVASLLRVPLEGMVTTSTWTGPSTSSRAATGWTSWSLVKVASPERSWRLRSTMLHPHTRNHGRGSHSAPRHGPKAPSFWRIISANVTDRSGLDIFFSSPSVLQAHLVGVQETRVVEVEAMEHKLRRQGWRGKYSSAVATSGGGLSGGTLLAVPKHVGLAQVESIPIALQKGRAMIMHVGGTLSWRFPRVYSLSAQFHRSCPRQLGPPLS